VEQEGELRAPIVLNERLVETIHLDGGRGLHSFTFQLNLSRV